MKYNVTTIEQYLEVVPEDRKLILERIISLVNEHFPAIEGNMQYNMPTFEPVCAVASQKHHVSVYIHRVDLVEKYRAELGTLRIGKSCIRFNKIKNLPEDVLRKIFSEMVQNQ